MSHLRYYPATPDGWLAVGTAQHLVLVNPATQDDAEALWGLAPSGFRSVLDWLTRNGFSATPAFALIEWSGDDASRAVRAIVRGDIRVSVSASGADHVLDGSGVATWTEQVIADVSAVDIAVVTPGESTGAPWMPLESGAAFVSRVTWAVPGASPTTAPVPHAVNETTMVDVPAEATARQPSESDASAHPAETPAAVSGGLVESDFLDETMHRPVVEPAWAEPGLTDSVPAGDHDGMTIVSSDIKRMRAKRSAPTATAVLDQAPALFLELSTGGREQLTGQPVLVGRAPTATKVSGSSVPRLVIIPGDKDISRNHAQITLEGGTVVVTDLHSRNGTQVVMPGRPAQQLRQGEPTSVIVGTVVDLGGGVTLTVCEGS